AIPSSSPYPGSPANDRKYFNYYSYNPAKAKALLAAAGYPNGFSFKAMTIGTWFPPEFKNEDVAQAMVQQLAAVGVKVDLYIPTTIPQESGALATNTYAGFFSPYGGITSVYAQYLGKMTFVQHGWKDPISNALYNKGIRQGPKASAVTE